MKRLFAALLIAGVVAAPFAVHAENEAGNDFDTLRMAMQHQTVPPGAIRGVWLGGYFYAEGYYYNAGGERAFIDARTVALASAP